MRNKLLSGPTLERRVHVHRAVCHTCVCNSVQLAIGYQAEGLHCGGWINSGISLTRHVYYSYTCTFTHTVNSNTYVYIHCTMPLCSVAYSGGERVQVKTEKQKEHDNMSYSTCTLYGS